VVGTLLLAFGNGGVSYAEQTLPSGLAALLVASVPLWMALADRVINGQSIPLRGWIALVLGLAGIAILARPSGNGAVLPVLVVLGASASWGIGSVLAGRLPAPASPLTGSAMEMLTGAIVLAGLAAATGELTHFDPAHVSTQSLLGLLYLIGPGSLLALTCYVIALRRLPTAAVSTYAYVNPVVAVSLGALFLGERPTLATLLGGAVVIASVAILLINRAGSPPPPRTERELPGVPQPGVQIGPPVGEQVVQLAVPLVPCQPQVDRRGQHCRVVVAHRPGERVAATPDDDRAAYPVHAPLGPAAVRDGDEHAVGGGCRLRRDHLTGSLAGRRGRC
jgi:drug/metabolite transporter (DMT)-like permease